MFIENYELLDMEKDSIKNVFNQAVLIHRS